ncbi:hypothetical protein IAR55_003474 [Kwoniella newhampshirensis]|uniref:Uncharacterized protein n=1 Tax=Kwoniella newhampshirensis TaxID=1651941 RepID=A0AAW0YZI0_9TREE
MAPVTKKLSEIFNCTPSSSPRNSPLLSPTKLNDNVPTLKSSHKLVPLVSRSGMPCAAQLFDLFKFLASDNTNGDLDPDVDSDEEDEDDRSLHVSEDQRAALASETVTPSSTAPTPSTAANLERWIDETIRETELQRDTLSSRFTGESIVDEGESDKASTFVE